MKGKIRKWERDMKDCAICLNIIVEPAKIECGHRFCIGCIEESLKLK